MKPSNDMEALIFENPLCGAIISSMRGVEVSGSGKVCSQQRRRGDGRLKQHPAGDRGLHLEGEPEPCRQVVAASQLGGERENAHSSHPKTTLRYYA